MSNFLAQSQAYRGGEGKDCESSLGRGRVMWGFRVGHIYQITGVKSYVYIFFYHTLSHTYVYWEKLSMENKVEIHWAFKVNLVISGTCYHLRISIFKLLIVFYTKTSSLKIVFHSQNGKRLCVLCVCVCMCLHCYI